jgi:hypothetical protein
MPKRAISTGKVFRDGPNRAPKNEAYFVALGARGRGGATG